MLTHCIIQYGRRSEASPQSQQAIKQEVDKLLVAGFFHEVDYPKWLVNVVLIKKATRSDGYI